MLSISKLGKLSKNGAAAKAAAHYYSEKSADYYTDDNDYNKQGKWIGEGCEFLNLNGKVDMLDLQTAMAGKISDKEVKNVGNPARQMGYDLTFSAPKSVSVLWAFGDEKLKKQIEQFHFNAVEKSMSYLESKIETRIGQGGLTKIKAYLFAGAFTHHTSRALDPQLHTHVVIPNMCLSADGQVRTIHSTNFFQYRIAAGTLYQAELAYQFKEMGYQIEDGKGGTFKLKGLDKKVEELFSKRTMKINQKAEELEVRTYKGKKKIVLATRPNKQKTSLSERLSYWEEEIKENNLEVNFDLENKKSNIKSKYLDEMLEKSIFQITDKEAVFKEKDLIKEIAINSYGKMNIESIQNLFNRAIDSNLIVSLGVDADRNVIYSTNEMIKLEKDMLTLAEKMLTSNSFQIDNSKIEYGNILSDEQIQAIKSATGKSQIAVIQGKAGVGKTTIVKYISNFYKSTGLNVSGLCLSGQAAQNLFNETNVDSKTIALWEKINNPIAKNQVFIVDEAGMVGTRQMKRILDKVYQAKAKIILIGDEYQLQPIDAGGALHAIDKRISEIKPEFSSSILTIRRQKHEWLKEVVENASKGEISKSLNLLNEKNKIKIFSSSKQAKEEIIKKFLQYQSNKEKESIILTHRISDANSINDLIKEKLTNKSVDKISLNNGKRNLDLSIGDKVVFLKNEYKELDVRNGQLGVVVKLNNKTRSILIKQQNNALKEVNLDKYNHIDYGWAFTTHKAQGKTVDYAFVYGYSDESMASRQCTYVQLSRQRYDLNLFIVDGEKEIEREDVKKGFSIDKKSTIEQMTKSWAKDKSKEAVINYMKEIIFHNKKENLMESHM